jgi:translation initiation factor IF-1
MKANIKKKCTVKLKDGRTFIAYITGNARHHKLNITSKEWGDMIVDSREVKN